MSKAMNRFERVRLEERKWLERAWKDEELATEVGTKRGTIHKDRTALMQLEGTDIFIQEEESRYRLDKQRYFPNLKLNQSNATLVYTMLKRTLRQQPVPNEQTLSMLKDLAFVLHQPLMERLLETTSLLKVSGKPFVESSIFEKIVEGWLHTKVISIRYDSLSNDREPIVHRVHPYLIEPSPWNESNYLIGRSERTGKVYPFKLERIVQAIVTGESADIPNDFNEHEILQLSWGIWLGESAETVRLRFKHGTATRRLVETKWHPLEEIDDSDVNGDLIWSAPIANWREMLPWIRGWGADCEVLEPASLRRELWIEAKKMAEQYSWHVSRHAIQPTIEQAFDEFFGGDE